MNTVISTIIFDLNLTLVGVRFDDPSGTYEKELGVPKSALWKGAMAHWEGFETGKYGQDELARRILCDLHLPPEKAVVALRLIRDDVYLVDGMDQVLAKLHPNYRVVLLAGDGEDFLHAKLDKFGLKRFFHAIYCTCYEGIRKTDPEIYRNVLAKEQVPAEACLFVDDNPEFIRAATSVGMNCISFLTSAQLTQELAKYAIKI